MDAMSALLIAKALDGLSLRATAISQNIANANSPDYAPLRVSFEDQLRDAARTGEDAVRKVEPRFVRTVANDSDAKVRLDLEMASASQTSLRYSALIDVLNRQMEISHLAVTGGR